MADGLENCTQRTDAGCPWNRHPNDGPMTTFFVMLLTVMPMACAFGLLVHVVRFTCSGIPSVVAPQQPSSEPAEAADPDGTKESPILEAMMSSDTPEDEDLPPSYSEIQRV